MRGGRASRGRRTPVLIRVWGVALAGLGVICTGLAANGDILHLNSGGSIEGTITEQDERSYKVRTLVGTITVPFDAVSRIERKPSVLDEYVKLRQQAADTPAGQVELAEWCEEQGLKAAWRTHMKRAIELNPGCQAARLALGFVRVGGVWIDGRTVVADRETTADSKKADDRRPEDGDDERMVAAIQTQWTVRIRSIKKNKLESGVARLIRDGRQKIVEIRDPLAILPLARLLSDGNWACRDALVEVLSRFPHDEATMNLAALALVDSDEEIRRRALVELKRRDDPRIVPQLRRALTSNNDPLIRRAAFGLGMLEATPAVPDLIEALKARRRKLVEVSTRSYFGQYPITFDTPTVIALGQVSAIRHHPVLGIPAIGSGLVFVNSEYQMRNVTVFRTEVLEALKRITGENFGFDGAAWHRWYEEQQL